eukprot:2170297-Rhodomonas_salina.2
MSEVDKTENNRLEPATKNKKNFTHLQGKLELLVDEGAGGVAAEERGRGGVVEEEDAEGCFAQRRVE